MESEFPVKLLGDQIKYMNTCPARFELTTSAPTPP